MITGTKLQELAMHFDDRGSFTEFFRSDWSTGIEPAQWAVVRSEARTLRGMHVHRRHEEFVLVVDGRMSVGLYDMRPGSPTEGLSMLVELTGEKLTYLSFPRGIVHGWYSHTPTLHVQGVSENHDNYGADDNLGCHWSDPDLMIAWPERPTRISARADAFPPLSALVAQTLSIDPDFRYQSG